MRTRPKFRTVKREPTAKRLHRKMESIRSRMLTLKKGTRLASISRTQHGLNSGQSFQFSVNGQPTTDFAAVQAHITSLEATIEHGRQQGIEEFVKALSDEGKILATQVASLTDFAKSLTESQYTAWAGQYGDMPSLPLFGHHGAGSNRIENPEDMEKSEAIKNELGIQREILASHQKVKSSPLPKVEAKIKELAAQLSALEGN